MITAYGERILVRIVEKEKAKTGVLILKDEKKDFQIGQVVSIGSDIIFYDDLEETPVHVEDYVYTRKYAGLLIEYDGVEYVSLDTKEILAFSKELK